MYILDYNKGKFILDYNIIYLDALDNFRNGWGPLAKTASAVSA